MKTGIFLFSCLLGIHGAATVTHSLKYLYTASSGVTNLPEFEAVGLVDEVQMIHYDSNTRRAEPTQDWMNKVTADDPQYWERQTEGFVKAQQVFKENIETAKQRFNQTGGVHVVQLMYGCEWDNETGEVKGYHHYGYDGEDFIVFDLRTETWITPTPQGFITKLKWDHDKALTAQKKQYLSQICPEWLKKYVNYGRSSLLRTELPSVSLLQKSPSSPVSCHATGFYPDRALMLWRKDGEDLHEDVDQGEILPNHDGSFQMRVDLDLSSVKPEDWRRYDCVFQLSGVKEEIITKLDKAEIRINERHSGMTIIIIIIIITAVFVLALVLVAVIGFMFYKRRGESQTQKNPDSSAADVKRSLTQGSETSSGGSGSSSTENLKSNTSELDTLSFNSSTSAGSEGSDTPLITAKNDNLKRRGNPAL